jgi:hypothetical protein
MTDQFNFVDLYTALNRLSDQRGTGSELDESIEQFCMERQQVRARREERLRKVWEVEDEGPGPVG